MEVIVSTVESLIHVRLDDALNLTESRFLHRSQGVYFGCSASKSSLFVVARNLDTLRNERIPDLGTNRILEFALDTIPAGDALWEPRKMLTLGQGRDLHQIRWKDGHLWVVSPTTPHLEIFDWETGISILHLDLELFVPDSLKHPSPHKGLGDVYHFNSLHFAPGRLFVLAHNWSYGAFALEFAYSTVQCFLSSHSPSKIHTNLGFRSHDIFSSGSQLLVLDSQNQSLLFAEGEKRDSLFLRQFNGCSNIFPRGLAVGRERLIIGCGEMTTDPAERRRTRGRLLILDRATYRLLRNVDLGACGDVTNVLLWSERDYSDCEARPPAIAKANG